MKKLVLLPFLLLTLIACKQEPTQEDQPAMTNDSLKPDHKLIVYQMMTRLFGNTNTNNKKYGTKEENGVGKFNDITDKALKELKALGATHVWYTGVIEHATMTDYRDHGIELDDADVVKGRVGSPYAIKDYYDVNPDLAEKVDQRMEEYEALIERTHDHGLKVIMDFVPNHVARQYVSDAAPEGTRAFGEDDDTRRAFDPDNNFYYLPGQDFQVPEDYDPLGPEHTGPLEDGQFEELPAKATGNDVFSATPSVHDWFETVKLNYGVDYQNDRTEHFDPIPNTWHKMLHILDYWAAKGVDAFRCDMAQMVPVPFWNWAIDSMKQNYPEVIFIAEIYTPDDYHQYIEEGKFDYLYDKVGTYDALRELVEGHGSAQKVMDEIKALQDIDSMMLRFLENHDEQRIASSEFAGDPGKAIPAMDVTATSGSGPVMIYFGQEVGEPGAGEEGFQGDDGRTTIFDYWGVPEHQKWMNGGKFDGGQLSEKQRELRTYYKKLLNFAKSSPAVQRGDFIDLNDELQTPEGIDDKIIGYLRKSDQQTILVVSNFSEHTAEVDIDLSNQDLALGEKATDVLDEKEYELKDERVNVELEAYGSLILEL